MDFDWRGLTPEGDEIPLYREDFNVPDPALRAARSTRFFNRRKFSKAVFKAFREGDPDWKRAHWDANIQPTAGIPQLEQAEYLQPWDSDDRLGNPKITEIGSWKRFSAGKRRSWEPDILERTRRVATALYARGIRFVKLLGAGGFGLAALFEMTGQDGSKVRFVFKYGIRQERKWVRKAEKEKRILKRHTGALHVVQLLRIHPPIPGPTARPADPLTGRLSGSTTFDPRAQAAAGPSTNTGRPDRYTDPGSGPLTFDDINEIPNSMIVEHCERGDLRTWLQVLAHRVFKNEDRTARLPERVVREILGCLLRGVLAMEFPPLTAGEIRAGAGQGQPPISEFVPRPTPPTWPLIHFDLDPANILIGNFNTAHRHRDDMPKDAHAAVPVLKVNDFGLSEFFSPRDFEDSNKMWRSREYGKDAYLTPEQFSAEWDYVWFTPKVDQLSAFFRVAGQYSWKTNLFCIGRIMYACMTLHYPEVFMPTMEEIMGTNLNDPLHIERISTYGGHLVRPGPYRELADNYTPELRHFVAWCLAEEPARRPSLADVKDSIVGIGNYPWDLEEDGQDDATTRAWVDRSLGVPPGLESRTDRELQNWFDNMAQMPGSLAGDKKPWYA